ncbi:MAG: GH3 auxin-responsive promoter family protein [Acidimicrobiales bacterium]
MSFIDRLVTKAFSWKMSRLHAELWPAFTEASRDPKQSQDQVLREILARNADTTFGRQHGFGQISRAEEFRTAVPVQDYESLRPHIDKQELTGEACLTMEPPVLYAQTSGTLGAPKYLPVTASGIERGSRAQRIFSSMVAAETEMFSGKIFGITSPAVEGYLPGGNPFGSASGMVYEGMPKLVQRKYVIGPNVVAIKDHDLRYLAIAAIGLAEDDVTGAATANPSTLIRLHSIFLDQFDLLVDAIETGVLPGANQMTPEQQAEVSWSLRQGGERAAVLRSLKAEHGAKLSYQHIWPRLAAISTWTGGSCGFALNALQPLLSPDTKVVELGYSASEVRGAIGIDTSTKRSAPLLADNWFEFVDRDVRDNAVGPLKPTDFLGLHELTEGRHYYVYVTTFDGLYRYDMNDVVAVNGWFENTPCIGFVQKGRGVTNITGEKLSESQVLNAIKTAQAEMQMTVSFFIALADEEAAHYRLYVEHDLPSDGNGLSPAAELANMVEALVQETNIEYRSKRASQRLGAIQGYDVADGTGAAYRDDRVQSGQRDAQFKFLHLQYLRECDFDFHQHLRGAAK